MSSIDDAAELGAKLTVARAARATQAKDCEAMLKALAFLLREEAGAALEFSKVASSELTKELTAEATRLGDQARVLEGLFPEPEPVTP